MMKYIIIMIVAASLIAGMAIGSASVETVSNAVSARQELLNNI